MLTGDLERYDSRKRRRVSERRRVFSKIGSGASSRGGTPTNRQSRSNCHPATQKETMGLTSGLTNDDIPPGRCDSPSFIGDGTKISMKIQFHITMAPENEPLILDANHLMPQTTPTTNRQSNVASFQEKCHESPSIGDQLHERLTRQNTLSTRRRHQLLAMHQQSALDNTAAANSSSPPVDQAASFRSLPEHSSASLDSGTAESSTPGREPGVRSSTITGGMSDEATIRFLARHQADRPTPGAKRVNDEPMQREHIYFKRDGQRFGHEFTLKLAVERNYRCLLKVRPLIPLQAISIQGQQAHFMDCSRAASWSSLSNSSSLSGGAMSSGITGSWQTFAGHLPKQTTRSGGHLDKLDQASFQDRPHQYRFHSHTMQRINQDLHSANSNRNHNRNSSNHRGHQLATSTNRSSNRNPATQRQQTGEALFFEHQQSQMLRHFALSHNSSTSSSHMGNQLIYMFDWSSSRFQVTKNKARTQVQLVLKFKNGQMLSLPLQVKFYEIDCKQHLEWGNQLHFIDYDCSINNLGQIKVDRIQYY